MVTVMSEDFVLLLWKCGYCVIFSVKLPTIHLFVWMFTDRTRPTVYARSEANVEQIMVGPQEQEVRSIVCHLFMILSLLKDTY